MSANPEIEVAPWRRSFEITGTEDGRIPLAQINEKDFELGDVTIRYVRKTGLEKYIDREKRGITSEVHEDIRFVDNKKLPVTDLASVPPVMRWFTNTYGSFTAAALIHDWLIPGKREEPIIPEEYADRYFRFMLGSVGVGRFKRYIMWTAVALRTRWDSQLATRRALLVLWAVLALTGIAALFISSFDFVFGTGTVLGLSSGMLFVISLIAPFACALLWWRQWGAGIVAAIAAPWLLPPAVIVAAGYSLYMLLEWCNAAVISRWLPEPAYGELAEVITLSGVDEQIELGDSTSPLEHHTTGGL